MFALRLIALPLLAQAQDPGAVQQTVVTATRQPATPFEVPFTTDEVTAEEIERRAYRTTPQALRDVPGVFAQETSHGQGSPFIRGFTGFRNLFLIDGIRLNNSIFRDGPNQYWNTVDPFSIERLEVVKGPSSVLHGSDAIGGTVNAVTKSPYGTGGRVVYRYGDAENSHMGRAEGSFSLWGGEGGLLVGGTLKELGDLEGGENVGTQPYTGYDERDLDVKVDRRLGEDWRLVLAHQRVRQDEVPRTHRTVFARSWKGTTVGSDLRRDFDHERDLTYAQLHGENTMVSLSWHEQGEVRHRTRGNGAMEQQGVDVGTLGFIAQHSTESSLGRFTYGLDYYRDDVDSFSTTNPIQGPVGDDATYDLLGVFVQDEIDANERLTFILGGRFNYAAADADSVADPVTSLPISVDEDWSAVVGSARFLYRLTEETWNLFGGVSQGFRAPNLSDLTRFSSARTNEFEIPSPDLDPEHFVTVELGVKTQQENVTAEAAVFYTDISDQIVRFPTGNVNAQGEFEITKDNVGDGYTYGVEAGAAWEFVEDWTLFGNATYFQGHVETFPTSAPVKREETIDRLLPFMAQAGVRWERDGTWVEALGLYNAEADRLSTRDAGDTSRIPPGGTPAFAVLHVHAGTEIHEHVELHVGVDNVFDEDYRVHGSGQNMPGRNLIVGVTASF